MACRVSLSSLYVKVAHFFEGTVTVWELVKSGGWMMLPIILSSIAAMAIVAERLWTLRASRVTPEHLLGQVWVWIKDKQLNKEKLKELRANSPLGEILAAGLANSKHGREIMKECIEEALQTHPAVALPAGLGWRRTPAHTRQHVGRIALKLGFDLDRLTDRIHSTAQTGHRDSLQRRGHHHRRGRHYRHHHRRGPCR